MKKIFTLFLTLFVASSVWAYDFVSNGIYYNYVSNKTVAVTCYSSEHYSGNVTIPSSVTYNGIRYSVTTIGEKAFSGCSGLTSVTIPNSVTSIGNEAFSGCDGLTSITIPNSVTSIGENAFYFCYRDIFYSGSAEGRPWGAMQNNVYAAKDDNFYYEDAEKTKISKYIGNEGEVVIPNGVTSIGDYAFHFCSDLTSITIPNSVTSIGNYAFYHCSDLTSITIPNSVTSIGKYAFRYCSGLTSITIPNSVTSIGNYAFGVSLVIVIYSGSAEGSPWGANKVYGAKDENFYYKDGEMTIISRYIGNGGDVVIPNSVTSIGERAFENCTNLTSITIPNSITSLNDKAFYNCSGLTSVTIPNSVTSIEYEAFAGCKSLTSITLSDGVTSIDVAAFGRCTCLTSITIPNSVTTIKSNAFSNCTSLTSITFEGLISSCESNALASPTSIYVPCEYVEEYKNLLPGYVDLIVTKTPLINENKNCMIKFIPNCPDFIIEAVPNKGYKFVSWSDGNTDIERIVAVDSTVYEAIVEPCVVTATADSLEQGSVSVSYRKEGNYYVLTAMPNEGYHFVKWTDGSTANPRTVYPKNDESYVAVFEHDKPITPEVSISKLSNATAVTIVNGQILVNGEAPAFAVTVSGKKIANANLKAGVYFVVVDGKTVGVSVR